MTRQAMEGLVMKRASGSGGLVYSTQSGRMCPDCRKPVADCSCGTAGAPPPGDGIVRVSRETKGRKGGGVTVIRGLALEAEALQRLGKELRSLCASGGTCREGVIEVQGDHRDRVVEHLEKAGWKVKRAGG
jgi:translation initiation factor 1